MDPSSSPTETLDDKSTPFEGHAALDNFFADNATDDAGNPVQKAPAAPNPTPEPPKEQVKPTEQKTETPKEPAQPTSLDDSIPGKKAQAAPAAPAAPKTPTETPNTPKELREAYQKKSAEYDRINSEMAEARKQLASAKAEGEKAAAARIAKDIEELKRERDELNSKVAYVDFTQSKEYEDTYLKPLKERWNTIQSELEGWTYTDENDNKVPVTVNHVNQLLRMTTPEAAVYANKLFGPAASEFMAHRRDLLTMYQKRDAAVSEWKEKGSQLREQREAEARTSTERAIADFDAAIGKYSEDRKDIFAPDEANADEKAYFEKGKAIVDIAFRGKGLPPGLTPEQRRSVIIQNQANVAAKAAAFGHLMVRLSAKDAEIEGLKKKLAQFESTEPDAGKLGTQNTGKTGSGDDKQLSPLEQIDALPGL